MKHFNKTMVYLLPLLFILVAGTTVMAQPLNGTYTVYGTGADYSNLQAAANDLNSRGVSGPVVFKIRPGTWTSSSTSDASIINVSGSSSTNTITFEAENGNAATTEIRNTNTSSSSSSNFIFRFNNAKYIRVRNLTLNKTYSSRGRVLYFNGTAQYNIVEDCIMKGSTSTSSSTSNARVYATSMRSGHHNIVRNNVIEGGSYSYYWRGNSSSSSNLSPDNEFSGNVCTPAGYYGIYTYYTKNQKINGNTINSTRSSYFYGIYVYYGDDALEVKDNKGTLTGKTSTLRPLTIYRCDGTSTAGGVVSGNDFTISGSSSTYPFYNYYCTYLTFKNNKVNCTVTGSFGDLYVYSSYFGGNNTIEGNTLTATCADYVRLYTMYYSHNSKFNNNDYTVNHTANNDAIYFYNYHNYRSNNCESNNNKINYTYRGRYYFYNYWNYYSNNAKFNGNDIKLQKEHNSGYFFYNYFNYYGNDVEIKNNKVDAYGYQNYYFYNYFNQYGNNTDFEENDMKFEHRRTTSTLHSVYNYFYNDANGSTFKNNKIWSKSGGGYAYGAYIYSNQGNVEVEGNEIYADGGYGAYGLYLYYIKNQTVKNNAVYVKGGRFVYALMCYYPTNLNIYNNTFYADNASSTSYAGYFWANGGSYSADLKNNAFIRNNSASGYGLYLYGNNITSDYNDILTTGGTMIYSSQYGTHSTLQSWRNASGMDMGSLSYMPGFMNAAQGDLRPDPSDPDCWALNGRGVQIAGNDKDMNGNARALTTIQGVPDLGAYEFVPTSIPPNCAATPAAPAANTDQVFTFGQDTVAVMKWDANVPSNFSLKQYTGTNPPGILSINPTQTFFYVDAGGTGTNLDYEMDLYYKDPWMGTIASESALRLAENVSNGGWVGYAPTVSSSNTTRNFINTPGVMDVGALFTGIDVKDNAGVDAILEPVAPFCPGTYTVKVRIKNNGNNKINGVKIDWELNGTAQGTINHTSTIDINGSTAGNEAIITLGNVTFGNAPENIKVWTYEPNGNQDPVSGDDTLEVGYRAALQGTYTVGGATPDFATVVAANNAVAQFGTCGDVVFDIRPGTYTGQVRVQPILHAANTTGRVTFKSENGNKNSVVINHNTTNSDYPVVVFQDADDYTFKDLSIICAGPSYGRAVEMQGDSDNDSIVNCVLQAPTLTTTLNAALYAYYSNSNWTGDNCVFKDNDMSGGYYTVYLYGYSGGVYYLRDLVFDGNHIMPTQYGGYIYYTYGLKFNNNHIDASVNGNTNTGGMYLYYPQQSPEIIGNDIDAHNYYGMYIYQAYGNNATTDKAEIRNNTVTVSDDGSFGYGGIYMYYPRNTNIFNNSVNITNKNANCYGLFAYMSSSTYRDNTIRNNALSNTGGGYAMEFYPGSSSYNNTSDYNNLYTTGNNFVEYNNSNRKDLATYVAASGNDEHSISHDPGYTSEFDLTPDKNNAASWSLNGRAVHISGNDKDKDGNTRVEARADGVPDIGAYEFKPEVIPPLAKAVPATPVAGGTQVFTFGERPVARVTWDASFPLTAPLEVRQYSGEKGMGVASQVAPDGSMYFYTDIAQKGNGTTYKFDAEVDYMDIWLGDIASEGDLRLAHKYNSNFPWMVYSGAMSTANTTTDVLSNNNSVMSLHHFGAYTGLENGSAESAFVVPQGSIVICTGNSVQLNAEPQTGDAYQWYKNGTMISGATGLTYQATQAGDYSVAITYGTKVVEAVPVTVSTISPPNALVSANGPLTYCVGNGLTLDAGNAQGVSYQWQLNGNNISGATGSTYGVNQSGNYTVVVTNIGCSSTSTVTAVSSGPLTVDLGNDTSYCEVKGVYAQLDAGFPGAKYLWSTGDTTKSIEVRNSGTYWVEVDGGPNCTDRDQIEVTISPLPSANGISYVKNGNTYFFSPSGPINTTGYMWLFSDGSTSTQKNVSKTLNSEDLYVRLVLFNNCGTDTVQLGWKLGVEEAVNAESVSLYPNPAKNQVTVSVTGTALEEVEVVNGLGSVVYRSQVESGKSSHRVDLSNLSNGHYMLRARTTEGMLTRPFDVMK